MYMKNNIIIDPMMMNPHLKYLIPNSLYFTNKKNIFNHIWNGGEHINNFINKYKFDYRKDKEIILKKIENDEKFNNLFITFNILSTKEIHQGSSYKLWIKYYKELYNKFINIIDGKIIILENHAAEYNPVPYIKELCFKYDYILKRVCTINRKNINIYPYPFLMCTNNDPMYNLFNKKKTIINNKINKIFWAGNLFKYDEEWGDVSEHCNRSDIFNKIKQKYPNIIDSKKVPYSMFIKTISSYKYSLDLRGCSRLNKRLYEIFQTNSLLMAQKIDIIWPFDKDDKFSDECFFSNEDELYNNYIKLENDKELYNKCLNNQIYIVNKYFNNKWIWNYIESIIEK